MNLKLKPCPFCGGNAIEDIVPEAWGYYPMELSIHCVDCEVRTPYFSQDAQYSGSYREKAYELWNRRVHTEIPGISIEIGKTYPERD